MLIESGRLLLLLLLSRGCRGWMIERQAYDSHVVAEIVELGQAVELELPQTKSGRALGQNDPQIL